MRRPERARWFSGISTSSPYGGFAGLSIALWVAFGSGVCFAAERQRESDNSDTERVMRENPGFATKPAPPRAATVYLCKRATGRPIWTDTPCSRSRRVRLISSRCRPDSRSTNASSTLKTSGFVKKSQQTPDRELKLARKRLKEVLNG